MGKTLRIRPGIYRQKPSQVITTGYTEEEMVEYANIESLTGNDLIRAYAIKLDVSMLNPYEFGIKWSLDEYAREAQKLKDDLKLIEEKLVKFPSLKRIQQKPNSKKNHLERLLGIIDKKFTEMRSVK